MKGDVPEDDSEGKAFSKFVGSLRGTGGIDASDFGEQP